MQERADERARGADAGAATHDVRAPTYGELLARLSALERRGRTPEVRPLRARLRASVRSGTLDEVHAEMAAVALALETLEGGA